MTRRIGLKTGKSTCLVIATAHRNTAASFKAGAQAFTLAPVFSGRNA